MGAQMEMVVLGWFVLNLTNSPFLVGLVGSSRLAANILALFAGVVADKLPRHFLLAAVGFTMSLLGFLLLILLVSDTLEVWRGNLSGQHVRHSGKGANFDIQATACAAGPRLHQVAKPIRHHADNPWICGNGEPIREDFTRT